MPRGKNGSRPDNGKDIEWGGFIDVRLSNEDQIHFAAWYKEHGLSDMDDTLGEQIKVSVAFDGATDTYLCSLTSETHARANLRCVLTARAGLWEKAVALALYKHIEMLGKDWGRYLPKSGKIAEVD